MPTKRIDPIERALDAYFQLDTDQRATFAVAIKHVERFAAQLGHSAEQSAPTPKRGRPPGSKNIYSRGALNRPAPKEDNVELVEKLFGNNGAVTEGL